MRIGHKLRRIRVFRAAVLAVIVTLTLRTASAASAQASAGGNAAEAWRRVFPLIRERDEQRNPAGLLTDDEWGQLWDGILGSEMDAGRDERTRALMAKLQPAFELMDQAAAIEYHHHIPEPAEDAPPLVDVADMFPIDQVKALRQAVLSQLDAAVRGE